MEIVSGIQQFERAFASFSDSFIVIGGSACRAVLSDGPIQPRRTRDIDMVLVLENVGKDFISAFWKFIKEGGYKFASRKNTVAISAPVPHHLFYGNLPGAGTLVDDELYKVRIASHIARVLRIEIAQSTYSFKLLTSLEGRRGLSKSIIFRNFFTDIPQ